jgi:PAS domain S-box-containing protein
MKTDHPSIKESSIQRSEFAPTLPTILLVDDQPARLLTYESVLQGVGVRCVRALSGQEALTSLLKESFALILLDVSMPEMDGFEVARLIREHPRFEKTPIIFITGVHVDEMDRLKGYEAGAIDYIPIPIVPEILRSKVALLVELYKRRAELEALNRELLATRARLEIDQALLVIASESKLTQSEARYRAIFENPVAFTVVFKLVRSIDDKISDALYADANERALAQLAIDPEKLLGKSVRTIMQEGAEEFLAMCQEVLREGTPRLYETTTAGASFSMCLFCMDRDTLVSSGVDISARVRQEQATEKLLASDRAEKEWLAALLNSMEEEVYFTDTNGRYAYVNPAALRNFGHANVEGSEVIDVVSKLEVFRLDGSPRPVTESPPLRSLKGEIIRQEEQMVRVPSTGLVRHRQVSSAPVRDERGEIVGAVSVVRDVTEQRRADADLRRRDQRSRALIRLADQFRSLQEPADLAFAASQVLAETLKVDRCGYGVVDPVLETITVERDWNAPGVHSVSGTLLFREYGTYIEELKRGETVVCEDAALDARTAAFAQRLEAINAKSFINMPIVENGMTTALLYLNHSKARHWSEEELAFIRDIAERTRHAVERRRAEQTLRSDLRVTRRLRDIAARTVSERDLIAVLKEVLDAAVNIAKADGGTLQLLDAGSSELRFAATQGLDDELVRLFVRVDVTSSSSCGIALSRGARTFIDFYDPNSSDESSRLHRQFGLRCAQSTPLVSRDGAILGMFTTHWRSEHRLSERELRYLDLLARQVSDLIERTNAEQALKLREQQLQESGKRKDEFIAMLAHELRNPLVPIRAGVALIKKDPAATGTLKDVWPIMERQVGHMVHLIDDLLDVSRITSGRIELRPRSVSLSSLVESAIEVIRGSAAEGRLSVDVTLQNPQLSLDVDPTRVTQILINILGNAIKFTPPGGRITLKSRVALAADNDRAFLVLSVSDTGVGISPEALPKVFELFGQASTAGMGMHSGLGIGLALSRSLAQLHGGSLDAYSEGAGRGSELVLKLPVSLQALAANDNPPSSTDLAPLAELRLLVVDDNRDGAEILGMLLEEAGATVQLAFDGASGIELVKSLNPNVVILDIGMPGMDGYEVCKRLRTAHGDSLGIIALTGWGDERSKELIRAAGFDSHLTKPADSSALSAAIGRIARKRSSG